MILCDTTKELMDYCSHPDFLKKNIFLQVYEEFLTFSYWVKGFQPNNILEIGTTGSSFWILSKLSTGKKIAVDLISRNYELNHFLFETDWEFIEGDSHSDETFNQIAKRGKFDLIFIDGDHSYEGVKRDFHLYKNLLTERGYIAVHDIDPNHVFANGIGGRVYKFWEELNEGTKINLICTKSSGKIKINVNNAEFNQGFGGIGLWKST